MLNEIGRNTYILGEVSMTVKIIAAFCAMALLHLSPGSK
jgi:hypothetical protein